jgi:hypothetical protein
MNLAFACQGCNNHKYNRSASQDPVTGVLVPLFDPRRDQWSHHFAWNEDATIILGLSATGRATVECLRLNRRGLISLRRVLFAVGEHPREEG